MSGKREKIEALIATFQGQWLDARYLAYFHCFNQQLYFEAHEVLEALWLGERRGPKDLFYKGLIQFAGAFVHVQKNRRQPAVALLELARSNLQRYPDRYEHLEVARVLAMIQEWVERLCKSERPSDLLKDGQPPELSVQPGS